MSQVVGGFFALALGDVPLVRFSIWEYWTRLANAATNFGTGRAAINALVSFTRPHRIWVPAYLCQDVKIAVAASAGKIAAEVHTYGLTSEMDPDIQSLRGPLSSNDLVLGIDYFGWPPSKEFREWAQKQPDVVWVEDRAQTLWTLDPPWAKWCIFSPRKLLGVPNGGVLLGPAYCGPNTDPNPAGDLQVALPELMRFEDKAGQNNDYWYSVYQERERAFADRSGSISRVTAALLRRVPIAPLVAARQSNYRYLFERLQRLAAWPRSPDAVAPFGFVIAVEDAASLASSLARERLFCARHWSAIAADPTSFPREHALSQRLLTLPCDHRYSVEQLARLADAVERLASNPARISF